MPVDIKLIVAVAAAIGTLMVFGPLIGAAWGTINNPSDPENAERVAEAGAESVERAVEREVRPFLILAWIAERVPILAAFIIVGFVVYSMRQ